MVIYTLLPFILFFALVAFIAMISKKSIKIRPEEEYKAARFKEYFNDLQQETEFQEYNHKKINKLFTNGKIGFVMVAMIFVSCLASFFSEKYAFLMPVAILTSFVAIITFVIILATRASKLEKIYKEKMIRRMLSEFYPNYEYNPEGGFSSSEYAFRGFVSSYDSYSFDDYMAFKLDSGELVEMCNVLTTRTETNSDGDTHTVTTFSGIYGKVDLNLQHSHELLGVGRALASFKNGVQLDNDEFRKKYSVISKDEVYAYKVLTPAIMEKLLEIRKEYDSVDLLLKEKTLYFRYGCGSMFDLATDEKSVVNTLIEYTRELDFINKLITKVTEHIKDKDS